MLVLGAGMAGLAAARRLVDDFGYRAPGQVIVLEARNRTGGRIHSSTDLGTPIDLGATWIHGIQGNPVSALADRYGAGRRATHYDSFRVHDSDGRLFATADVTRLEGVEEGILEQAAAYGEDELDEDQSLAATLADIGAGAGLSARDRRILSYLYFTDVELEFTLKLSQLSTWSLDEDEEYPGIDQLFPGGYAQIIRGLSQGLDVRLGTVVRAVDARGSAVRVTTNKGTFTASRCVVALPLGVLKSNAITWTPGLPAGLRSAIQSLGFGAAHRLALLFPRVFWHPATEFVGYCSPADGKHFELVNSTVYSGKPILTVNTAGDYARQLDALTPQQATAAVMPALRKMYGSSIPAPTKAVASEWVRSPYTRGSYTYWAVDSDSDDSNAFTAPVAGRLFFAGEHTSAAYPGTVHGAYLSGRDAAQRVASA